MSALPPGIQRVCARCGTPVTVHRYITCPVHGKLCNASLAITRERWLALEAAVARHPAGKGLA